MRSLTCLLLLLVSTSLIVGFTPRVRSLVRVRAVSRSSLAVPSFEKNRFDRIASSEAQVDVPCIIVIGAKTYNMTTWAKAHPGGVKVLQKFNGKDAMKAFDAAGHSNHAMEMLKDFEVVSSPQEQHARSAVSTHGSSEDTKTCPVVLLSRKQPRWRMKLFTKEDPIGIHKYCGVFVLLHFAFRFYHMLFGDPSAGFGGRLGKGPAIYAPLCLIPHAMLSLSSLIFHTVPKERVVGKPMIWQEFRVHNIAFAMRSILATLFTWLSLSMSHNSPTLRNTRMTILAVSTVVLVTQAVADKATQLLRVNTNESTTATMPYWEGCSVETQRRFKSFYAMCQFDATLACLSVANPAWGFAVLLPIQLASLLMTLVRKSLLSPKGYHVCYTVSLVLPYLVAYRSVGMPAVSLLGLGWVLYQLRRRGINKYALWIPVIMARFAAGQRYFGGHVW
jgi:Cytochrome b5-like Heme/Steroid binding domain